MRKVIILLLIAAIAILPIFTLTACNKDDNSNDTTVDTDAEYGDGVSLRLIVPAGWELEIGDSRTVDYAFADGITNRMLTWKSEDENVATVDEWGRVTAVGVGKVKIVATTSDGLIHSATLHVVEQSASIGTSIRKVDYTLGATTLGDNLQKVVTRYPIGDGEIPTEIDEIIASGDYANYQSATTSDGAVWTITNYGVLRVDENATLEKDKEQRFMSNRYFYEYDTTTGKVYGIVSDGTTGIWTIMATGVTHIAMVEMTGEEKAIQMSDTTQENVSRHGYVAEAYYNSQTGEWVGCESDNDGLWTSMYAAGELMRYATLKAEGASEGEIKAARQTALISTEAVLLLSNICMRTGTVEAYERYQPNGRTDTSTYSLHDEDASEEELKSDYAGGRYRSTVALIEGGDYSRNLPSISPSDVFSDALAAYQDGDKIYYYDETYMQPYSPEDWADPRTDTDVTYAKRTRNLEGWIARTYSFQDEAYDLGGYIYWWMNEDGTATGVSTKPESETKGWYLNGENLRGVTVDASGVFPERLWTDLVNAGCINENYTISDVVYKGDTSSDEIIGHLFLYKLAYDILGPEDEWLKSLITSTVDRLAQHVSDNSYMMCDGTGQPDTWAKFNRDFFYNSSQLGGAPLTSAVALCMFKLAAYVTGNEKWEAEYRMAALDPSYEYAELMTQYTEQCYLYMMNIIDDYTAELNISLGSLLHIDMGSDKAELLTRLFLNYSDEEMAMLAFYLLFQMEDDETLLTYYREALNDWWVSIKYSENPLWYYIYQLAYPNETKYDAYGNSLVETAAWSLSRHPIDTIKWCASNTERDDIAEFSLQALTGDGDPLSYSLEDGAIELGDSLVTAIVKTLKEGTKLKWAVAAPDERAIHKFNGNTYELDDSYQYCMEGSTTYTLPYWLGRYHGLLVD